MPAELLNGKEIAEEIRTELLDGLAKLKEHDVTPGLGVLLIGDDPASKIYVGRKEKMCQKLGIHSDVRRLPADISQEDVMKIIHEFNENTEIDGILVQLPLPKHLNTETILYDINPDKDVDGLHPVNAGRIATGTGGFVPCTPGGVIEIFQRRNIPTEGVHIVVTGRSNIVGRPLVNLLTSKPRGGNATVTVCHSRTPDLAEYSRQADIVIAAIGVPEFIKGDMIKEGAVIIDVGMNRVDDSTKEKGYRLAGDVHFPSASEKAKAITPVPGGVGPLTIIMLMKNIILSAQRRLEKMSNTS